MIWSILHEAASYSPSALADILVSLRMVLQLAVQLSLIFLSTVSLVFLWSYLVSTSPRHGELPCFSWKHVWHYHDLQQYGVAQN